MIDRRTLLTTAAAAGAVSALPNDVHAQDADGRLDAMLSRWFDDNVDRSPELATSLGLDVGARAGLAGRLSEAGVEEVERERVRVRERWATLRDFDTRGLTGAGRLNYDIAAFSAETAAGSARFDYGSTLVGGRAGPYVVSQLSGAYFTVPDFLDSQHRVEDAMGADAFLSRLGAFAEVLDQETGRIQADGAKGVVPSTVILSKTLRQIETLRDQPTAEMAMIRGLGRRTTAAGLEGDWAARATALVDDKVKPALNRQAEALKALQPQSSEDVGVWRLPDGEALYAQGLKVFTTTSLTGAEIHRMGLEQVAEINAAIDAVMKMLGMTQGTVGERVMALNADPAQLWPNTDEAKVELIASLNAQVQALKPLLPRVFKNLPKSDVEVRRVPPSIQIGAPGGYYQGPPLDGSRPGAYYINLRDTANWPRFALPTLTYHEASPGHHLQIALTREAGELPLYRRAGGFSAYSEGWALYAEAVAADDLDVYADNPLGRIGFLMSYLFRAVRLVVDSGLHHERWGRQQAIDYMIASGAKPANAAQSEIDRYCVMPGQACAYKVGHTVIARLRAAEQARPGFDLRDFHDRVLRNGSVPLAVLERQFA